MLLDQKIAQLLLEEDELMEGYYNSFITELSVNGLVDAKTFTTIEMLFYLLSLNFPLPNLNLELYKKLVHVRNMVTVYTSSPLINIYNYMATTNHNELNNLIWENSNHTGNPNTIACFDANGAASSTNLGALITSATPKVTPIDADTFSIVDSISGLLNKVTFANIKATLLAYFQSIFLTNSGATFTGEVTVGGTPDGTMLKVVDQDTAVANFEREISSSSDINYAVISLKATKGTNMGDGFGSLIAFEIEDNAGITNRIGYVGATRTNNDDNSGSIIFNNVNSGVNFTNLAVRGATGETVMAGSYGSTTASAANVFIDTDGTIKRSTSSERYKEDIEEIDPEYSKKIYDIAKTALIFYKSKCAGDNKDFTFYGISAEKLAAVEPRLVHWGYFPEDYNIDIIEDKDGNKFASRLLKSNAKLSPVGVQYERFVPLVLQQMALQEQRLQAIEDKLKDK